MGLVKNLTFLYKRADFYCTSRNFNQNMMLCYSIDTIFVFFYILHFFEIIIFSLFLAWLDQYFIMFKDLNIFKFTNFPFKTKYNNAVVYFINTNYSFSRGKQEKKLLKQFFKTTIYLLIFRQNSMIFKGSPNSLNESYFTGELGLGEP